MIEYTLRSKNRRKSVLFFAILLWLLMGFSSGTSDYYMYESYFVRSAAGIDVVSVEPGFILLNRFASRIGLDFVCFLALYSLIAFCLIGSAISRYARFPNLVLFAYFCYPFILDITQIRHFMVSAIVIYSVRYLEEFSVRNALKYSLCVLIASTQQITAFIYLFFLLAYIPSLSLLKKISIWGSIALIFCVQSIPNTVLYSAIIGLRDAEKVYDVGMSGSQLYLYVGFFLFLIGSCVLFRKQSLYSFFQNDVLYKVCLISVLFIPFLSLDFQFTRFFRGVIILIYIYITNVFGTQKSMQNKTSLTIIFVILLFAVGFKLFGPGSGYFESLTNPVFTKNKLFSILF